MKIRRIPVNLDSIIFLESLVFFNLEYFPFIVYNIEEPNSSVTATQNFKTEEILR